MKPIKPFLMALFGTFVEYYDYALYGFSAPILAQHFFPKADPIVGLLQTYGIFIAGSCAKPVGSLLFGYLGDRFGRAIALKISICGIALPTFFIGLLPDFSSIGYLAPLALLICRIFQGIFVSGESDTARVFLFEMLPEKYRCFSNSMAYFICMIGIYAASFIGPSFANLSSAHIEFAFWRISCPYWRIPFLFGGILGLLLFILRRNLQESELFLQNRRNSSAAETKKCWPFLKEFFNFSKNGRAILITLLMTGAAGGQYHFYFVFLNQYLYQALEQCDAQTAAMTTSNLLLCFALLLPFAGLLADHLTQKYGYCLNQLLKRGAQCLLFIALINIFYIFLGTLPIGVMFLTVVGLSFTHANTFVVILNQFAISDRCKGVSIGHSLGSMILSGSAPLISLGVWKITQWKTAPLFYFFVLCIISYIALLLLEQKKEKQIEENTLFYNYTS